MNGGERSHNFSPHSTPAATFARGLLINLSFANLRSADLSDATLSDAVVENAQFGGYLGLTEEMKLDLKRRGAIFEDSPGDRSWVFIPR